MIWGHGGPEAAGMLGLPAADAHACPAVGSRRGAGGYSSSDLANPRDSSGLTVNRNVLAQQGPVGCVAVVVDVDGVGRAAPVPGCGSCSALSEALLEAEFLQELSAAQLTVVREERDLLAQQHESLLQLLVQSSSVQWDSG
jgi:hypothetical protein